MTTVLVEPAPAGLAGVSFEIGYLSEDGAERRVALDEVAWLVPFERGRPVRRFAGRKGQVGATSAGVSIFSHAATWVGVAGPVTPRTVDTARVAAAAARDVSKVLDEAGVRLRIGALPTVDCDDVQLQRVFQNLLTNAAVYHHRTVTPRIEISARQLDGHWEFTVADNGPGVQGGARDSIFGMFQRGPDADAYRGHGMGLALCRRIIESYGGHIWVQDNPGGGSRFCFTLPTPAPPSPAADAGA